MTLGGKELTQDSYRKVRIKFKDFSRTSKDFLQFSRTKV